MNLAFAYLLLLVAAGLEAGGDALVRVGLHSTAIGSRAVFLAVGAVVLFGYGCAVNAPPWDFGISDLMHNMAKRELLTS